MLASSVALRLGHCNDRTIAYWRRRDASGDAASDAATWQKDINGDGLVNGTWTKSRVGDLIHLVALSCTINHQSRAINHYPVSVATAAQTLGTRAQEHKMCMRVPALCTVSSPSGGPWPFREKALKRQGLARRFFREWCMVKTRDIPTDTPQFFRGKPLRKERFPSVPRWNAHAHFVLLCTSAMIMMMMMMMMIIRSHLGSRMTPLDPSHGGRGRGVSLEPGWRAAPRLGSWAGGWCLATRRQA